MTHSRRLLMSVLMFSGVLMAAERAAAQTCDPECTGGEICCGGTCDACCIDDDCPPGVLCCSGVCNPCCVEEGQDSARSDLVICSPMPGAGTNEYWNSALVPGNPVYQQFMWGLGVGNIGGETVDASTSSTAGITQNLYRLDASDRFMQIGMSWLKYDDWSANNAGIYCDDFVSCAPHSGPPVIKPSCSDIYTATTNYQQATRPRSNVNASLGTLPGGSTNQIEHPIRVDQQDICLDCNTPNAGASYFIEAQVVGPSDKGPNHDVGNQYNNASYRPVNVTEDDCPTACKYGLQTTDIGGIPLPMVIGRPAIRVWGADAETDIQVDEFGAAPYGLMILAVKTWELNPPSGIWHYEYAIQNLNSHRSGAKFSIPIDEDADVQNIGFHDVDYHTGDGFDSDGSASASFTVDGTDWASSLDISSISWSIAIGTGGNIFEGVGNANALRWGTLYNFWFDIDRAPVANVTATIGLFRESDNTISTPLGMDTMTVLTTGPADCGGINTAAPTVEWVGPITGPPVSGTDYTVTVGPDCAPDIVLETTAVGGRAVTEWIIGRNLGTNLNPPQDIPGAIGSITSAWVVSTGAEGATVTIGSLSIDEKKAKSLAAIQTAPPLDGMFLNLDLEIIEDVSGTVQAHTGTGGGLIRGAIHGSAQSVVAQSIGGDGVTNDLTIGKLTGVGSSVMLVDHPAVADTALRILQSGETHVGDILVDGDIAGDITISGDMAGDIIADADSDTFGSITGQVTVTGCFTGDLCGENLFPWAVGTSTLPSNIDITFGPGATICGVNVNTGISAAATESSPITKNRFISLSNPEVGQTAIAVKTVSLAGFSEFNDRILWAGPPTLFTDANGPDFTAAALQCDPYYTDWGTSDIHIYGAEIVPASSYESWIAEPGWDTSVSHCGMATLADSNAKWGDVITPFDPIGTQPDFKDISAIRDTFLIVTGAVPATQAQLLPNAAMPERNVGFKELTAVVQAFLGGQYTAQTGVSGPCPCPSLVTCGATVCTSDSDCSGGLCPAGFCTDECGRCD